MSDEDKVEITAKQQEELNANPADKELLNKAIDEDRIEKAELAKIPKWKFWKKPKQFKFVGKNKSVLRKSKKRRDEIACFVMTLKGNIEVVLTKIYGGNFLVVNNHVYRFKPTKVHNLGKYKCVIAREWDRELVGHDEFDKTVLDDYTSNNPGSKLNIDDPVLIKAIIMAHLSEKTKKPISSWVWIVLGLIVVGVIAYLIWGGGSPQVVNQVGGSAVGAVQSATPLVGS